MLNDSAVLKYIKRKCRFPFQKLELTDAELLDHIKELVLEEFSSFIPKRKYIKINPLDPITKVNETQFRILDPDDDEILWVDELVQDNTLLTYGHPIFGPFTYSSLPPWYLDAYQARTTHITSIDQLTFEFEHPNLIRMYNAQDNVIVIYSCNHMSFTSVPSKFGKLVKDMCLAEAKLLLGNIRERFTDLPTPFGAIQLDGDKLTAEGQTLWDLCMERLNLIPPKGFFQTDV